MESGGGGGSGQGHNWWTPKSTTLPRTCKRIRILLSSPLSFRFVLPAARPLADSLPLWFCKQPHANVMNAHTPLRLFIPSADATACGGGGSGDIGFAHSSPNTIWHQGDGTRSGEKGKGVGRRNRHRTARWSVKRVDDASLEWSSFGTDLKRSSLPEF